MVGFEGLGLKKEVVNALTSSNFKKAFEVQEKVIPLVLNKKNVVFTSKTGSGKTLAYTVPFLSRLNKKLSNKMIIIVPTRELCIQVAKEMRRVCDLLGLNVGTLYGGKDIKGDERTLSKKNQILVGTPGRLIQHVNEKRIKVGDVNFLVYDESDQMFDNGFYSDCAYLKKRVSKDVQTILASATITEKVERFIKKEIKSYEFIEIGFKIPETIIQEKKYVKIMEKNDFLIKFLKDKKFKRILVFCNTKTKSEGIKEFFTYNKYNSEFLSSDLMQKDRENILNLFKLGKIHVLVATDIAARGLHIEKVDIVINYDVPTRDEFYIHRIGRTGRVDQKGYSLTLICPEDEERWNDIEFDYELEIKEI